MKIAILIYFAVNIFAAGDYWGSNYRSQDKLMTKFVNASLTLAAILFFTFIMIAATLWGLYKRIDDILCISFIVKYRILHLKLEVSEDRLKSIQAYCDKLKPEWWNIQKRLFMWNNSWVQRKYGSK